MGPVYQKERRATASAVLTGCWWYTVGMKLPTLGITLLVGLLALSSPIIAMAVGELKPVPLGSLAAQLYVYSLRIVGLCVFVMFLLAGLAKMIPAIKLDSYTLIKNAIIGLVILASAYVILNSISRSLIEGTDVQVPQGGSR
jgi:ABC-type amino acid transport system permease subunit